jgi:hypothetical protein
MTWSALAACVIAMALGAMVPRTTNLSGAPAHQLIICTPAGFERYFARMAAERQGTELPKWAKQPLPKVTTLGPPIDPDAAAH